MKEVLLMLLSLLLALGAAFADDQASIGLQTILKNSPKASPVDGSLHLVGVQGGRIRQLSYSSVKLPFATANTPGVVAIGSGLAIDPITGKLNNTGVSGVASFNGRGGAVQPQTGDYSIDQIAGAAAVAKSGSWLDLLFRPVIPPAQVAADWGQTATTAADYIKNKPIIPSQLAQLSGDTTHRTVTDTEKEKWNLNSPTVSSVNGQQGAVMLGAVDVGADPLGSATSVQGGLNLHIGRVDNPHQVTKAQLGLSHVPDIDATNPSNIVQDATHRFASDAEKNGWNAKQPPLGYVPENAANKAAANGYASLDATGKIPTAQIPAPAAIGAATATQGVKADSALQPTGNGSQLTGITPAQIGAATAAQGTKADSALQPTGNGSQLTGITPAQIGAATAVQGTKADSALQPTAGVGFYPASDDQHAAIEIDQVIHTSTDDRQGAIHATTTGPDTHTGAAANWLEFISTGSLTGGFDSALTTIVRNDSISGGTGDAQWWVAATPNSNTGNWVVNGGEINTLNAYADMGYQEDVYSAIKPTSGLYMVPESELNVGRGVGRSLLACVSSGNPYACCTGAGTGTCQNERGYNSTYGIMFGRSAGSDYGTGREYPASKWWVPVYVGKDATAPTGTSILLRGGTAANKSPGVALKIKDYQTIGIDTSTATISGHAIKLAAGQTIGDTAGNSVTVSQLATLAAGGTTDTDAIHRGGANEFTAVDAKVTPVSTDYLLIEDSASGYIKKKVTAGSLPPPTSLGTSANVQFASQTLNGSDWITGTGTVSASGSSALVANTTGSFAALKAGGVIKFSNNTEVSVLSVSGDTATLAQITTASALTWSYRNPAVTWQANGSNVGFLEGNGSLQLVGDGLNGPRIYTHSWGTPGGLVGFTGGGTPAAPSATAANTILYATSGGGLTTNSNWVVGAGIQYKAGENWGAATAGSGGGTYTVFNTTSNNTGTQAERVRIDGNGRVGVNTTAATAMLHVKGKTTAQEVTYTRAGPSDGLRDLTATGTYTGPGGDTYTIIIDATGTPDTFKWRKNSGSYTTGVAATGSNQTLSDGVQIKLAATTGHTLNDQWVISMPVPLEIDNASGTALVTVDNNGMTTEKLVDYTASFTVVGSTSRITLATGTATATLPKTLREGTTSVLVTVAGAAASGVSFAAESGGSISFGDAGNPAFASNKSADVVCVSENAAATTAAAWRCVKGGDF